MSVALVFAIGDSFCVPAEKRVGTPRPPPQTPVVWRRCRSFTIKSWTSLMPAETAHQTQGELDFTVKRRGRQSPGRGFEGRMDKLEMMQDW